MKKSRAVLLLSRALGLGGSICGRFDEGAEIRKGSSEFKFKALSNLHLKRFDGKLIE